MSVTQDYKKQWFGEGVRAWINGNGQCPYEPGTSPAEYWNRGIDFGMDFPQEAQSMIDQEGSMGAFPVLMTVAQMEAARLGACERLSICQAAMASSSNPYWIAEAAAARGAYDAIAFAWLRHAGTPDACRSHGGVD
jgi:hypothetical protein